MATEIRAGEILRPPLEYRGMPSLNPSRETQLSKLPPSWRTALGKAEEWPFVDPDVMLATQVPSFGDFPADDSVPDDIIPFSEFEPWGKMEDETGRDYELFSYYRASGLSRSQSATARHFGITQPYVGRVAARCNWLDRVDAWDKYREQVYTTQVIDGIRKMADDHAQIASKGIKALSIAFDKLLERMEGDDPAWQNEIDELSFRTLFSMVERSGRVLPNLMGAERLSRGLPTELTAQVIIKENRVVVQSTEDLAQIVQGLQSVLQNTQPSDDPDIIDVDDIDSIEDAVLVD